MLISNQSAIPQLLIRWTLLLLTLSLVADHIPVNAH